MPTERFPRSTRTRPSGGRICNREPYPATVAECLEQRTYRAAAVRAIRAYRRSKPWRGDAAERAAKLHQLHRELCAAYGLTTRLILDNACGRGSSGSSCYSACDNLIKLRGRFSVLTYLHEFGHALGYGEQGTCRWAINLFRRFFPRSFAGLRAEGHMLVR